MTIKFDGEIIDNPQYGVVVNIFDMNLADEFEDFLTEQCFVFFTKKIESQSMRFFFGQASSIAKIEVLKVSFLENIQKNIYIQKLKGQPD